MTASIRRLSDLLPDTHDADVSPGVSRTTLVLAIADRRKHASHESIGLEAEFIEEWRRHAVGVPGILKSRSETYARGQNNGENVFTVSDICEAIKNGGREGKASARAGLLRLLRDTEPKVGTEESVRHAAENAIKEAGDVTLAVVRAADRKELRREVVESIESFSNLLGTIDANAEKAGRS
jgi:hypothetical protein